MLNTGDILTEGDVLAFDSQALENFGVNASDILAGKRAIAVDDWLRAELEKGGLWPDLHVTRREPAQTVQCTGGVWGDVATLGLTGPGTDLAAVVVTPTTDALYVASDRVFRGLAIDMTSSINVNTCTVSGSYWNGGAWASLPGFADGTVQTAHKAFSGGGLVTWVVPAAWQKRLDPADDTAPAQYWVKLSWSAVPSPASMLRRVLPIVRSRLTRPAAFYALFLLYEEADSSQRGKWAEKATRYEQLAMGALGSVLALVKDEFDIDASEATSPDEVNSATVLADQSGRNGPPYRWERG